MTLIEATRAEYNTIDVPFTNMDENYEKAVKLCEVALYDYNEVEITQFVKEVELLKHNSSNANISLISNLLEKHQIFAYIFESIYNIKLPKKKELKLELINDAESLNFLSNSSIFDVFTSNLKELEKRSRSNFKEFFFLRFKNKIVSVKGEDLIDFVRNFKIDTTEHPILKRREFFVCKGIQGFHIVDNGTGFIISTDINEKNLIHTVELGFLNTYSGWVRNNNIQELERQKQNLVKQYLERTNIN